MSGPANSDEHTIAFSLFLQLLGRKLEHVAVYYVHSETNGFEPSIALDAGFVRSIFSAFDVISDSFRLQQRFKQFAIVEPKQDIASFVEQYQAKFAQKGWTLQRGPYEHAKRGLRSDNALIITPATTEANKNSVVSIAPIDDQNTAKVELRATSVPLRSLGESKIQQTTYDANPGAKDTNESETTDEVCQDEDCLVM